MSWWRGLMRNGPIGWLCENTPDAVRLRWPIEQTVGDLNRFLRGWAGYFCYSNPTV